MLDSSSFCLVPLRFAVCSVLDATDGIFGRGIDDDATSMRFCSLLFTDSWL